MFELFFIGLTHLALRSLAPTPLAAPLDLPAEVLAAIPDDIDLSEVNRDLDGCYFYTYGYDLFQVLGAEGEPVCLSD